LIRHHPVSPSTSPQLHALHRHDKHTFRSIEDTRKASMRAQQWGDLFPFGEAERKHLRGLFAQLKSKHLGPSHSPV
jgi:hypothetical protein